MTAETDQNQNQSNPEEEEISTEKQETLQKFEEAEGEWYVIHTYAGYEDSVAQAMQQRVESLDMEDKVFSILVPKENQIEIKDGERQVVKKKIFPGYVLVNMDVDNESWYVVRNTPNVTGFVGSGNEPIPISDEELDNIKKRMEVEEPQYEIDVEEGDLVEIEDGPFEGNEGTVSNIDPEQGKLKVLISLFGRETPVELDFLQVKKI